MNKILALITGAVGVAVAAVSFILILASLYTLPVYLLWNWVGVKVLSLPHITFLQAWGLLMLSNFLFKNSNTSSKS